MHETLAQWHGNVASAYLALVADGHLGTPPRASQATFYRAVNRELSPGQRAALKGGEADRRRHDVHALRPHGYRNDVWETDHVEASVFVNVDGRRSKPWITWFIDHATAVICGLAVTPHQPSQDAILAAARDAILCTDHHRPFGGIPRKVRVDRGRDFLGRCVAEAFQKFGTELIVLPPYSPHLKGTVEAINGAAKHMLFKGLPGYAHTPEAAATTADSPCGPWMNSSTTKPSSPSSLTGRIGGTTTTPSPASTGAPPPRPGTPTSPPSTPSTPATCTPTPSTTAAHP